MRVALNDDARPLQRIQPGRVECPHPAPQHEQLGPLHRPDRVDLQAVDPAEEIDDARFAGLNARPRQRLDGDG